MPGKILMDDRQNFKTKENNPPNGNNYNSYICISNLFTELTFSIYVFLDGNVDQRMTKCLCKKALISFAPKSSTVSFCSCEN